MNSEAGRFRIGILGLVCVGIDVETGVAAIVEDASTVGGVVGAGEGSTLPIGVSSETSFRETMTSCASLSMLGTITRTSIVRVLSSVSFDETVTK